MKTFCIQLLFVLNIYSADSLELSGIISDPEINTYNKCIASLNKLHDEISNAFFEAATLQKPYEPDMSDALGACYSSICDIPDFTRYMVPAETRNYNCFTLACSIADRPTIDLFLNQGFDPKFRFNRDEYSSIELSALYGNMDALDLFLIRGYKLSDVGIRDLRSMLYASEFKNAEALRRFFSVRAIAIARNRGAYPNPHKICLDRILEYNKIYRSHKLRDICSVVTSCFGYYKYKQLSTIEE